MEQDRTVHEPDTSATAMACLARKLCAIMEAVDRVPKRGRNEFHKYDYATEADIVACVRHELATRHVILIPSVVGETRAPVGEKGSVLTCLEMTMEFLDGDTGASIVKPWRGWGTDKEDKGGYKAMTGAEKYFLLKTFLMPTGDDPEAEQARAPQRASRAREAAAPASAAPDARITPEMVERLKAAMRDHGIATTVLAPRLRALGYAKYSEIRREHYDGIVAFVQAGAVEATAPA